MAARLAVSRLSTLPSPWLRVGTNVRPKSARLIDEVAGLREEMKSCGSVSLRWSGLYARSVQTVTHDTQGSVSLRWDQPKYTRRTI